MNKGENVIKEMQGPPPLSAEGDSKKNWCSWRSDFVEFLKKEDPTESYKDRWGTFLLLFIGPVGQEAYKKLSMDQISDKENFNVLLKKLDFYFLFGSKQMQRNESISEYVNSLMDIAVKSNHRDPQGIVKEKIIDDIMQQKSDADFQRFLQSLNLSEIISEWMSVQKFTNHTNDNQSRKQYVVAKKCPMNSNVIECIRCGRQHARNKCPAHGKQCGNCKKFNHFTEKCKSTITYVENCKKCGAEHKQTECPAFGYTCTKCGKNNHYSWKCQVPMVRNCSRCGTDHIMTLCPAQGKLCSLCKKPNHLEKKCSSK